MTKRVSLFVAAAAVAALVLSGCGGGPGTSDDMADDMSLDGTWYFHGFVAMIEGTAVTVTVGDGTMPLSSDPPYSAVTQVIVKGTLTQEGTAHKLMLAEGSDAITVMPAAVSATVVPILTGVITTAQSGTVMITVADDTMTIKGSFLDTLAAALGTTVPETGLVGCKDAPCMMAS